MNLVSQTKAAKIIGTSQPYINTLIKLGKIKGHGKPAKVDIDELKKFKEDVVETFDGDTVKTFDGAKTSSEDNPQDTQIGKKKISYADARTHKEIFNAKLAELLYKEKKRGLIPMQDAKAAFEKVATPFNQSLNDLPFDLKARFSNTEDDAIEWMVEHINAMKLEFQDMD